MTKLNDKSETPPEPERFRHPKDVAEALGIYPWALIRAINRGLVPSYQGLNSRRLVRLSEVLAVIESTKAGGAK